MVVAVTGCTPQQAASLLAGAGGDIELAVTDFFIAQEGGGDAEAPVKMEGEIENME